MRIIKTMDLKMNSNNDIHNAWCIFFSISACLLHDLVYHPNNFYLRNHFMSTKYPQINQIIQILSVIITFYVIPKKLVNMHLEIMEYWFKM